MNKDNYPICTIDKCGNKWWTLNGELHREDGPAIEHLSNGSKYWYFRDQRHRIDGPAVEWDSGYKFWYYHGKQINCSSQKEFERLIKLRALW